jgi:hypothetical protein
MLSVDSPRRGEDLQNHMAEEEGEIGSPRPRSPLSNGNDYRDTRDHPVSGAAYANDRRYVPNATRGRGRFGGRAPSSFGGGRTRSRSPPPRYAERSRERARERSRERSRERAHGGGAPPRASSGPNNNYHWCVSACARGTTRRQADLLSMSKCPGLPSVQSATTPRTYTRSSSICTTRCMVVGR